VFDATHWAEHKQQPNGMYASRVELEDSLRQAHFALFCSRTEIYLCTVDKRAPLKQWFGDSQPGARVQRGFTFTSEVEVALKCHSLASLCHQSSPCEPFACALAREACFPVRWVGDVSRSWQLVCSDSAGECELCGGYRKCAF
jgi:hypothetical protein